MARPPALGDVFAGRFELRELLVRGRMGSAFAAWDRDVDELVAVMIVADEAIAAGAVDKLRAQVRIARRVTHRNIARTYDLGEHQGRRFVTVEYVDGQRLADWLTRAPSQAAIVDVTAQLAEGLAAAHAAGVIHCNVAPHCVMIDHKGRAVIGNFGFSRFEAAETIAQITNRVDDMMLSAAYLAPEQVLGETPTAAVDVYGLGLLVWEMLTGEPRFRGEQPFAVGRAQRDDDLHDPTDPRARDPRISPILAAVIAACLASEPDRRIGAAALAVELREALRHLTGTGDAPIPPAPALDSQRHDSLAVLPFRYRGPRESDYLAEALFDELVDLLSQTRGLRVFGSGATAGYTGAGDRDPKILGEELGADVIVDGTILLSGRRLRISARLLDVDDGFQLWHGRFEGSVADVFELQDKMAKRIAEALRVELEVLAHRGAADVEAIESYLRGRQAHLRWNLFGPEGAIAHYRAALERAPEFKPALGHLALASVLAWFQPRTDDATDWAVETERAVERAMSVAPELPETRLAAGNLDLQRGEFRSAAGHLLGALKIAPTFALAHERLGRLLIEAKRPVRGIEHLELAVELDPALSYCLTDIARHHALHGELDRVAEYVARLRPILDDHRPSTGLLFMRVGAWTNDTAMIREGFEILLEDEPRTAGLRRFGASLLGLGAGHADLFEDATSPRLRTLVEQLFAEQAAFFGDRARTLRHLAAASELTLIDLEWLDNCPLFEDLREQPGFVAVRSRVLERCEQVWSVVM